MLLTLVLLRMVLCILLYALLLLSANLSFWLLLLVHVVYAVRRSVVCASDVAITVIDVGVCVDVVNFVVCCYYDAFVVVVFICYVRVASCVSAVAQHQHQQRQYQHQ